MARDQWKFIFGVNLRALVLRATESLSQSLSLTQRKQEKKDKLEDNGNIRCYSL